VKFYF